MEFIVNGESYSFDGDPNTKLLWVIRDELGLTGTKFGCGEGVCGACTILLDGSPLRSCIFPVSFAENKEITTLEGLATKLPNGEVELSPVQTAFQENQVHQCGYCMSGQMITATYLLEKNPAPSRDEIREAMSNNYCRCGTYPKIEKAVEDAAEIKRTRGEK
jgi:isoquinoline 1-oxidoreductase alpha subunit